LGPLWLSPLLNQTPSELNKIPNDKYCNGSSPLVIPLVSYSTPPIVFCFCFCFCFFFSFLSFLFHHLYHHPHHHPLTMEPSKRGKPIHRFLDLESRSQYLQQRHLHRNGRLKTGLSVAVAPAPSQFFFLQPSHIHLALRT
jgi:hypothetical protein